MNYIRQFPWEHTVVDNKFVCKQDGFIAHRDSAYTISVKEIVDGVPQQRYYGLFHKEGMVKVIQDMQQQRIVDKVDFKVATLTPAQYLEHVKSIAANSKKESNKSVPRRRQVRWAFKVVCDDDGNEDVEYLPKVKSLDQLVQHVFTCQTSGVWTRDDNSMIFKTEDTSGVKAVLFMEKPMESKYTGAIKVAEMMTDIMEYSKANAVKDKLPRTGKKRKPEEMKAPKQLKPLPSKEELFKKRARINYRRKRKALACVETPVEAEAVPVNCDEAEGEK